MGLSLNVGTNDALNFHKIDGDLIAIGKNQKISANSDGTYSVDGKTLTKSEVFKLYKAEEEAMTNNLGGSSDAQSSKLINGDKVANNLYKEV